MPEPWELAFKESLVSCAHAVAAELKETDPDAEERALFFAPLLRSGLFCPERWVRHGQAITLHRARWLLSCGEHDYKVR